MAQGRDLEIVATLGPASWNLVVPLLEAGATAFRLNASHMAAAELAQRAAEIRRNASDCHLIVDLQGAKMRLGDFAARAVRTGEHIRFSLGGIQDAVPLPHREIFVSIQCGDTLSCDDDRLHFRTESVDDETIDTVATTGGLLQPRKGVNVLEHPVALRDVSGFDLECIRATADLDGIAFAFSFMSDGSESPWIHQRRPGCSVIGKIERREAVENLTSIARAVESVWICRGDLGAQLGTLAMARWISELDPRAQPCPVLMAGQVLEHLTTHATATRSEICHLYDLIARGYAGFVLSDETAIGADPVRAVSTLHQLIPSRH
jgi:pyruvate kinase